VSVIGDVVCDLLGNIISGVLCGGSAGVNSRKLWCSVRPNGRYVNYLYR